MESNLKRLNNFYLKAQAIIWPVLSYMCHIGSTPDLAGREQQREGERVKEKGRVSVCEKEREVLRERASERARTRESETKRDRESQPHDLESAGHAERLLPADKRIWHGTYKTIKARLWPRQKS
jgi:hypothetical protein